MLFLQDKIFNVDSVTRQSRTCHSDKCVTSITKIYLLRNHRESGIMVRDRFFHAMRLTFRWIGVIVPDRCSKHQLYSRSGYRARETSGFFAPIGFCFSVFQEDALLMAGCVANTIPCKGEYARRLLAVLSARPPSQKWR